MKGWKDTFQSAAPELGHAGYCCSCLSLEWPVSLWVCRERCQHQNQLSYRELPSKSGSLPLCLFPQSVLKWWLIHVPLIVSHTRHPGCKEVLETYKHLQYRSGLYREGGWVMLNESWMSSTGSPRKMSLRGWHWHQVLESAACSKDNIAFCLLKYFINCKAAHKYKEGLLYGLPMESSRMGSPWRPFS